MVVVREAVDFVDGDVQLVGPLDEIEAFDRERRLGLAAQTLRGELFEIGVGAVAADAVRIEQAEAEDEVVDRVRRSQRHANANRIAGVEYE